MMIVQAVNRDMNRQGVLLMIERIMAITNTDTNSKETDTNSDQPLGKNILTGMVDFRHSKCTTQDHPDHSQSTTSITVMDRGQDKMTVPTDHGLGRVMRSTVAFSPSSHR